MYGDIMKCSCGRKDVVTPKNDETQEQYLRRKLCLSCRRKGQWRILTEDEARWD
jgi:hypothetical protein